MHDVFNCEGAYLLLHINICLLGQVFLGVTRTSAFSFVCASKSVTSSVLNINSPCLGAQSAALSDVVAGGRRRPLAVVIRCVADRDYERGILSM